MIPHVLPQLAWPEPKMGFACSSVLRSAADCRVARWRRQASRRLACSSLVSRSDITSVCSRCIHWDAELSDEHSSMLLCFHISNSNGSIPSVLTSIGTARGVFALGLASSAPSVDRMRDGLGPDYCRGRSSEATFMFD